MITGKQVVKRDTTLPNCLLYRSQDQVLPTNIFLSVRRSAVSYKLESIGSRLADLVAIRR
jgi:hypothetical protein